MVATSADELLDGDLPTGFLRGSNTGKSQTVDELTRQLISGRNTGKAEMSMFQMYLQTALAEVAEYTRNIEAAKTQAKKDFYKKKIKKVTKRLQKLLPTG